MSEWFHGRWDLRSGSIRPSMKAIDLCFGSVKLTDRRKKPTSMLNYLWKTKIILDSKAGRPMGKSFDFWLDWKILDGWCQSADGEASDFEKMIQSRWKAKSGRSIMTANKDGWIRCKGHLPLENKFAMQWITSFWLSTRIELIGKNNESWGWRGHPLLKFEQENVRPWLAKF